jgi:hypothetical protein
MLHGLKKCYFYSVNWLPMVVIITYNSLQAIVVLMAAFDAKNQRFQRFQSLNIFSSVGIWINFM